MQLSSICAGSGYGNEMNYEYMISNQIAPFVKYKMFHTEMQRKFLKNPFHQANMFYTKDLDFNVCPMGQRLSRGRDKVGTRSDGIKPNLP